MGLNLEVLKWEDSSGGTQIVQRLPSSGMADLKLGARVIVQSSQAAVFFRDGKALDVMPEGSHTLSTMNVPLISKLFKLVYSEAPFQAAVYFVSQKPFRNLGWGTKEPITLQDSIFGLVRVRAFGKFSIRVTNPQLFINEIVGTEGRSDAEDIERWFKTVLLDAFSDVVSTMMTGKSVVNIQSHHADFNVAVKAKTSEDFQKCGIDLYDFKIESLSLPEAVQKKVDERAGMGAVMAGGLGMNQFMQYQTAEAIEKSAGSPNSSGMMNAGLGMGMGMMMPGMMAPAYAGMYPQGQPGPGGYPGMGQPQGYPGMGQPGAGYPGGQPGMAGGYGAPPPSGMGGPPPLPGAFTVAQPYYAAINGAQAGPFDGAKLKEQMLAGALKQDTLVWKTGMGAWTKASDVGELVALFAPPPLPGPPPLPAGPPPLPPT